MKQNTVFNQIHDIFEPICDQNYADTDAGLPEGFTAAGDRILYAGIPVPCEKQQAPVREDGPDAWGCQIKIPAGGAYRWGSNGTWYRGEAQHSKHIWLTQVGTVLDVVYVLNGVPCRMTYTGTKL